MRRAWLGGVRRAGCRPAICAWIVFRAVTEHVPSVVATPDDHFTVSPDCGMRRAWFGALVRLIAIQLSVPKSYVPPVSNGSKFPNPPQTIILLPVQTAV